MYYFAFVYSNVLIPHLIVSQTFSSYGPYEYYIKRKNPVRSYSEAKKICNPSNATLAIVNTEGIGNDLVKNIGNSLVILAQYTQ